MFVRPVTAAVECQRPLLAHTHAQRLAGHLRNSKPPQSSEKAGVTAVSCEVQSATKPASLAEKLTSVEPEEPVTLPRSSAAGLTQDIESTLQQKKDALRLVLS